MQEAESKHVYWFVIFVLQNKPVKKQNRQSAEYMQVGTSNITMTMANWFKSLLCALLKPASSPVDLVSKKCSECGRGLQLSHEWSRMTHSHLWLVIVVCYDVYDISSISHPRQDPLNYRNDPALLLVAVPVIDAGHSLLFKDFNIVPVYPHYPNCQNQLLPVCCCPCHWYYLCYCVDISLNLFRGRIATQNQSIMNRIILDARWHHPH